MPKEILGVVVPLLTPLTEDGKVDCEEYVKLAKRCVDSNVDALFLMGTAGEGYSLSTQEKVKGIHAISKALQNKITLVCGVLEPSTNHAIDYIRQIENTGIKYYAVVPPFYDDVDQEQIVSHYATIRKNIRKESKLVIYNIPGATGVNILPETVKEIKKIDGVVGIKNSCSQMDQLITLINLVGDENFSVLQGYEDLAIPGLIFGADGIVPCSGTIFPEFFAKMIHYAKDGNEPKLKEMVPTAMDLLNMQVYSRFWLASLKASGNILGIISTAVTPPYNAATADEMQKLTVFIERIKKEVANFV